MHSTLTERGRSVAPHEAPPHVLLDAYLTAASSLEGEKLRKLAAQIGEGLAPIVRKDAVLRRTEIIVTLLANVIAAPYDRASIAVPFANSKLTRYDRREIISSQLKPTVLELRRLGVFNVHPAHFHKRRTVIEATPRLKALIAKSELTSACLSRAPHEELILLRRRKAKNDDYAGNLTDDGEFIDYVDCEAADYERSRMRRLNKFLASADVRIGDENGPAPSKPFVRIFASNGMSETLALHGRLYRGQVGGWHQGLPKTERHLIRIDGEPCASIDYSSLHVHLAYAEAKAPVPSGDLYAVEGLDQIHRPAIKIVMSALLARRGEMKQLPHDARLLLPKDWNAKRLVAAIKVRHAPIAYLFGVDFAMTLLFRDSELLMAVLEELMAMKIVALPLHDAVICKQSAVEDVKQVMHEVSKQFVGYPLPVAVTRY